MAGWIHGLRRRPCATCGHRPVMHGGGKCKALPKDGCKEYVRPSQ